MKKMSMLEKYYHSQGAAFLNQGRLDEAIECFQRALALDDQPYTHWDLCRIFLQKDDTVAAQDEINRAIELRPRAAQYRYRRSLVRLRVGHIHGAREDREASALLDPNYLRIDEIVAAAGVFEATSSWYANEEWLDRAEVKNGELAQSIDDLRRILRPIGELEKRSCPLSCPAYCCHFSGETIRHGLYLGPWKLHAIRSFLRERGLRERDFLDRVAYHGESHLMRLIPPDCIVREGRQYSIYYPKRGKRHLGRTKLKGLPKGNGYGDLEWIDEKARACAFLEKGRCMVHDAGDEPALPACKEFLCLTARIFMVLGSLGALEERDFRTRSMEELNRIAVDLMLTTAELIADPRFEESKRLMAHSLRSAMEAEKSGNRSDRHASVDRYRGARRQFMQVLTEIKARVQRTIRLYV